MTFQSPDLPPDDAPDSLKAVWPLVLKWGTSDDTARKLLTEGASNEELQDLANVVEPLLPGVNSYLNETGDAERAVPFGDLAQAGIEARMELNRRLA